MSTTAVPAALVINTNTPLAPCAPAQTWLQRHERLIIVLLVVMLGGWFVQRHYDRAAAAATTRATIAEAKAATADSVAAQSAATLQQAMQQVQAVNATLTAQNAVLAQLITSRQAAVVVQQKTDATLPPSALASRIATLASAPPAEVTLDGANINLGRNAAVDVAQTLELVPVLQANLASETEVAKNLQTEINEDNLLMQDYGKQITDLSAARTADAAASKAEIAQVKAEAKKNNIKWFKRGLYVGFGIGFIIGEKVGKIL